MAYKFREEIVGKRFLSVSGFAKLKVNKISEWGWRAGVIRAASHRDNGCQDLQVLVEYDDVEWQRREWLSPHRDAVFSFFLVEKGLCWAERIDPRHNGLMPIEHYNHSNNNHHHRLNGKLLRGSANTADTVAWPAISFYPLVARAELHEDAMPVEFMQDRKLEFLDYSKLKPFADWDLTKGPMPWGSAVRRWAEMQDGQRILLTTPSILVGFRVEVYRAEGTTQWYTAVIVGYNEATKDLTVTDDTVLEDHNEDPGLVQMRLIGDGVVESIMRGEVVGMTPRRSRSSTGLMTHAIVVPRPGRRPRGRPGNNSQIQSSLSVQNSVSQQIEREKGTVRNNRRRRVSEGTPRDGSKVEIVGDEASPLSLRQEDRENKGPAPGRPGIRTPRSVLEETNNASGSGGVSKLRKRSGTSNLKQVNVETNPRRPVRNSNRRAGKPGHEAKTREDDYEELDNDDEAEDDEEEEQENRLSPKKLVVTNSEVGDEDEDEEEEVVEEENEDDNDGEEDSPQVSTQQNSRERTDPLAKRLKAAASTRRLRSDRKSICGINEEIVRVKTPTLSPTIANTEVEKDKEEVEKAATIKSRRESEESIEQEEEESESRERDREPEPPPPDKSDSGGVTIEKKSVIDFNAEGGSERLPDCTSVHEDSMVNGVSAIHDSLDINEDREKTRCDIPNSETRTLRLPAKDRRKEHKNYKGESVCLGVNTRQEDHPRTNKTSNEKNDTTRTIIDRDSDEAAEEEISRISRSVIEGGIKNCSSVDKTSPAIAAEAGVEVTEEVATSLVSRSPSIVIGRGGSSSVEFIEASSQDGSVLERLSPLSGGPGRQNLLFEEQERNRHNESPVILSERLNKPPPTQSATAVPTAHHPQNRYQHQQQQQQQPVHYIRHQQSASAQQQNHNPHNFHHQTLQQTLQQQQQQHHHHHHPHPNPHNNSHHLHHHNQRHSSSVSPHNPQQQQHQHRPTNTSPHVELNLSSSSPSSASSLNERRDSHLIHQTRGGDEASHLMQVEAGVVGRLLPGATSIVPGGGILGIPGPTSGNNASNVNTNSHHLHHQQQQQQQQQQHQQQQSQPQHHPHQQQHVHQNLHHHQQHHSLSTSSGVLGSGLTTSGGSSRSASAAAVVAAATAAAAAAAAAATSGYGDSGSDSGVSSLRSAGSGDERSGSRSSALSAEEITTAVAPSSSSSSASSSNSTVAAVAAASATPARVWHVQSVQHTSLLMAHPQAHPAQIPAPSSTPSGSTGSSATTTTTTTLGYHSPASGGQSQQSQQQQHHHHSTTEILWRPPRYPPLPHGLLAPSQPNSEEMHERDRILRERREVEVREQEKRERDYEARMERDRLEKQRLAEQAVHKHFEVSLRLAEQKRNMQSASIPWNSFVPLPPPVSRSHGGPPPHGTLTGHGAPHHHPAGPGGATHPVTVVQQQQQQQQQHREREERDARDREREAQIREREQREREREHHAATERLHRQAEARDHAARDHAARAAYYAAAAPPTAQQVLRTSSMSGKVEYPPPPAHSRASKSSLTVTGHHEKAPPPPQVVGPPHSGLPKAEPNVSLFSYSNYQPQSSYMHEMKVKNDLQHKTSTGKVIDRDHHSREMLPNPPPLLPDHKSSVIVKNDGRDLQQKVQAPPHSSSPKMMSYLSVQSVTPSSIGVQQQQQQQQQQQHKNVAYEYRSPTQSPHLHHLDSLQAAKGMSPQVGHHGRMNSVPTQLPPSPHGHSTHPHNRQSPHGQPHPHQAPHPSPPEPRYLSRPEPGLPYAPAKSPYSYSHLPTSSPSSHYSAPPPGSKPKVSSPAPPHIYGKPNSGIMTGTPVCRASEPVVTAPLPLTSKTVGSSPYQQVPHHHGAPPPPLPPPAHSSRSVYDTRTYAGSLPTSKLPPPQLHGSPPSAASAPLSRPLVSHPSHHMSPHQPGQPIQHQQSSMNSSFQTQPLDLGVERTGSPKRKAHTPIDQPGQAVSLEICKKRRLEEPQPLSLQCVGPPVLSRVSEPTPLIASAATSITTVVNTALLSQPNTQNQDSRSWTSLSPAPRTDSGDGSIRPASTGSVSSLNPMTNATPSTAPSPAPISSPAPTTAAPSPAPSAPGTPAKVNPTTTDSEKSNSPAPRPPSTTNYPVHKLKKAWLQRHSGEDGTEDTTGVVGSGSCVMLPLKIAQAPSQPLNNKELEANSTATGSTTTTTSTNVTAATTTTTSNTGSTTITATTNSLPSAVNSIHNIGSMAVNSINRSKVTGKNARKSIVNKDTLNGHANDAKSNVQEDSSSSDPDRKSPPKRKPPKVKRKKGAVRRQQAAVEEQRRRKEEKQVGSTGGGAPSDSSNDSEAGSGSDASEQLTSSTQSASRVRNANTNSNNSPGNGNSKEPRKRGRRPKTSKGKEAGDEEQQPRQKKERRDDNTGNSGGSGNGGNGTGGSGGGGATGQGENDGVAKPTIAQLKKSGASWLQDDACVMISRIARCRECMGASGASLPHTFCRFYQFRRLRYSKSGVATVAGFSDPHTDIGESDLSLWLPGKEHQGQKTGDKSEKNDKDSKDSASERSDMDLEMAHILLRQVGDQFCDLLNQETDALARHIVEARSTGLVEDTVAWKRVIKGVRELCDVCETTLFNIHWACGRCGFVVCIDCYQGRKNGTIKIWGEFAKDRDDFSWIVCKNRQAHDPERLMLTQIIPGDTLVRIGDRLHECRSEWGIPQHCGCRLAKPSSPNEILRKLISGDSVMVPNGNVTHEGKDQDKKSNDSNGSPDEKTNGEDKNSPLNWLADVALQNQEKNESNSSSDSDEDRDGNYSTLRELLIRPSHKPNGTGSRSNSPTNNSTATNPSANSTSGNSTQNNSVRVGKKSKMDTLDEVISSVIEHSVKKERDGSMENDEKPRELKHFVRRYKWAQRGREPLPIRIMTLTESKGLYPDVPHSWLCDGKLLKLNDPNNPNNYRIFQDQWKRGQPVIVSDVSKSLDMELWHPDSFARDFGNDKNDFINCMTGNLVPNQPMRKFWEGFEHFSKRLKDDRGNPMLLKLKDWPPGDDFSELLPSRFADLMKALPLSEYTHRNGRLNLVSRLPERCVRPDLGPKMYTAYGSALYPKKGTTNLHLDISDAVNVMVYVGIPKDGDNDEHVKEALRAIDEAGCDILTRRRVRERGEAPGALWHIYAARDADKIRDLLNAVALERGARLEPHHDPIHDQSCYLDGTLRERLYREYGVEGYAIVQCLGDAVFVPAGAPHQVRNLHNCIKVAEDFVSPENVSHCFHLTQEFRALSESHMNREDKLQIKNIIYHAVKDSLTVLARTKEEALAKHKAANNEVKVKEET